MQNTDMPMLPFIKVPQVRLSCFAFNQVLGISAVLGLTACQTVSTAPISDTPQNPNIVEPSINLTPTPDPIRTDINSSTVDIAPPALPPVVALPQPQPIKPPVLALPPRVILPPQQPSIPQHYKDGRQLPAYKKLMQDYIVHLRENNLPRAEAALTHAQRLAPQSADVYRELARLTNLKGQSSSAEAFARKGLMFAQSNVQRQQLWQQILISAKRRSDAILIQQANLMLAQFSNQKK